MKLIDRKMIIRKKLSCDIELSLSEVMNIIREFTKKYPKAVKIITKYPCGDCLFPDECIHFPCENLNCEDQTPIDVYNNKLNANDHEYY